MRVYTRPLAISLAILNVILIAPLATAGFIRIDSGLQSNRHSDETTPGLTNNGSSGAIPIESKTFDGVSTSPLPFNLNVFGTSYSNFYVNENGSISFGSAFSGTPGSVSLEDALVPVIAPFYADVDTTISSPPIFHVISNGSFENDVGETRKTLVASWEDVGYQGQTPGGTNRNTFQLVIEEISDMTGNLGDFRLEFNYGLGLTFPLTWETGNNDGGTNGLGGNAAQAGFFDGFGVGYFLPGSAVPGALISQDCNLATSLLCNDHIFEFLGGVPHLNGVPLVATTVPEPGTLWLFAMGSIVLLARRKSKVDL